MDIEFRGSGSEVQVGSEVPRFGLGSELRSSALRMQDARNPGTPERRNLGTAEPTVQSLSYGVSPANRFDRLSRLRDAGRRERRGLLQLRAAQSGALGVLAAAPALGRDLGFTNIVTVACVGLYLATLAASAGHLIRRLWACWRPTRCRSSLFGASGTLPVFEYGRWWTVLSAGWLHAAPDAHRC